MFLSSFLVLSKNNKNQSIEKQKEKQINKKKRKKMILQTISLIIVLINTIICWYSYIKQIKSLRWITKTTFCLFLALYTYLMLGSQSINFIIGLLLSALGDYMLLYEGNTTRFSIGASSFLIAHINFSYGFNSVYLNENATANILCYIVIFLPAIASIILGQISKSGKIGFLEVGCFVYMSFVSLGMYHSFKTLTDPSWNIYAALMSCGGYFSFFISDVFVSYSVLVKDSWLISLMIIVTYHIAQFGIIFGIVLNTSI